MKTGDGDGKKHIDDILQGTHTLKAEEEEVCSSKVEDVDREGILVHMEAQKPQHCGISCHPNQGDDDGKEIWDKVCSATR